MSETNAKCPDCGSKFNRSEHIRHNNAEPDPGDISICFCCGAVNLFDQDMNLEQCPDDELDRLDELDRSQVKRIQRLIKYHRSK